MINPYLKKLTKEDFQRMTVQPGMMVVEALLADSFSKVVTISNVSDYNNALVHRVITHGKRPEHNPETLPQVGQLCFIVGNCLDKLDDGGPWFVVREEDAYLWWGGSSDE